MRLNQELQFPVILTLEDKKKPLRGVILEEITGQGFL
jgi:hypothetical protein